MGGDSTIINWKNTRFILDYVKKRRKFIWIH